MCKVKGMPWAHLTQSLKLLMFNKTHCLMLTTNKQVIYNTKSGMMPDSYNPRIVVCLRSSLSCCCYAQALSQSTCQLQSQIKPQSTMLSTQEERTKVVIGLENPYIHMENSAQNMK
jgi:hypothetical protein